MQIYERVCFIRITLGNDGNRVGYIGCKSRTGNVERRKTGCAYCHGSGIGLTAWGSTEQLSAEDKLNFAFNDNRVFLRYNRKNG